MSRWAGALSELRQLEDNLHRLSGVPSRVASDGAERIDALIEDQFDAGTDPYGVAWEALAESTLDKGRFPPPLTDTTALRSTRDVSPMAGAGISITFDEGYAGFHQGGTRNMPERMILPNDAFPPTWEAALEEASSDAFADAMGGSKDAR